MNFQDFLPVDTFNIPNKFDPQDLKFPYQLYLVPSDYLNGKGFVKYRFESDEAKKFIIKTEYTFISGYIRKALYDQRYYGEENNIACLSIPGKSEHLIYIIYYMNLQKGISGNIPPKVPIHSSNIYNIISDVKICKFLHDFTPDIAFNDEKKNISQFISNEETSDKFYGCMNLSYNLNIICLCNFMAVKIATLIITMKYY